MKILSLLSLFLFVFFLPNAESGIYGTDDRLDYHEIANTKIAKIAHSIAHIVPKDDLIMLSDGNYKVSKKKTLIDMGFCPDVNFAKQSVLGHCSASLVGKDTILTAGHCFHPTPDHFYGFKKIYVIFDYFNDPKSETETIFKKENVFEIDSLLFYDFPNFSHPPQKGWMDLAVAKLNRKTERTPLKYNLSFNYAQGTPLFVLGFPLGLPLKYADNAEILKLDTERHSFHHQLDTFSGNSGSSVFNAETHEIIGVLSRGDSLNQEKIGRSCFDFGIGKENQKEEATLLWNLKEVLGN